MCSCECESVTPTKRVKYLQQRHDRYQDRCQCGSCLWHGQWCPSVPQNDLPLCCPGKTCSPPLHRTEVYSQQYLSLYILFKGKVPWSHWKFFDIQYQVTRANGFWACDSGYLKSEVCPKVLETLVSVQAWCIFIRASSFIRCSLTTCPVLM